MRCWLTTSHPCILCSLKLCYWYPKRSSRFSCRACVSYSMFYQCVLVTSKRLAKDPNRQKFLHKSHNLLSRRPRCSHAGSEGTYTFIEEPKWHSHQPGPVEQRARNLRSTQQHRYHVSMSHATLPGFCEQYACSFPSYQKCFPLDLCFGPPASCRHWYLSLSYDLKMPKSYSTSDPFGPM